MTTSKTVELRPLNAITAYADSLTSVLPTHVNPKIWIGVALDAIRRDKQTEQAAANDMGRFFAALRNAARLGLEPGTEQFYLVPFKTGGKPVLEGIVGYQGMVELMYRAGAVKNIVAEPVFSQDKFMYRAGIDPRPIHEPDWFSSDRGELIGVYAYAILEGGITSKVILLSKTDLDQTRARSQSAKSSYSPWNTDYQAMALKTAVRQLYKWVPTSAEYLNQHSRTITLDPEPIDVPYTLDTTIHVDDITGEIINETEEEE